MSALCADKFEPQHPVERLHQCAFAEFLPGRENRVGRPLDELPAARLVSTVRRDETAACLSTLIVTLDEVFP
jgi:hypothetical protein